MQKLNLVTNALYESCRENPTSNIIKKNENSLEITFLKDDNLEKIEIELDLLFTKNRFISNIKRGFRRLIAPSLSIFALLFMLLALAIFEDFFKKLIFERPLIFAFEDIISLVFVLIFVSVLVLMPSIMHIGADEFKNFLSSFFNKNVAKRQKIKSYLSSLNEKCEINIYNFDIYDEKDEIYVVFFKTLLEKFNNINLYIRENNQDKVLGFLKKHTKTQINIIKKPPNKDVNFDLTYMLSSAENRYFELLKLCSYDEFKDGRNFVSLELFEYLGKDFIKFDKSLNSGFDFEIQSFINRCFNDFYFLKQEKSLQHFFVNSLKAENINKNSFEFSQYLRNHLEDIVVKLENPISFMILYKYLKSIVLDEKRVIKILEKFIKSVKNRQQYEFINSFWLEIAAEMFEINFDNFEETSKSYYRKISIESLDDLAFLFERSGNFEQAILIYKYLFEINPNKYALNISSLYERMGDMQNAFLILPKDLKLSINKKPSDLEVRYYQRKAAFIIISSQDESKKEEAIKSLKKLENLIFSHNEDNNALWLWHFYNINANLCEWEKDYNKAIEFYKKCLQIPSLGYFEYGATFVNMAISYRFLYINNKNEEFLEQAIKYGEVGLNLKELVGEKDEMAIVYHNFVLTILYKVSQNYDEKLVKIASKFAKSALEILRRTNSKKRLGMVLIENYILSVIKNENSEELKKKIEDFKDEISNSEIENMRMIYNNFKEKNKKFTLKL